MYYTSYTVEESSTFMLCSHVVSILEGKKTVEADFFKLQFPPLQ